MYYIKNIKILHLARSLESIFQTVLAIEFTLPVNAGISCVFRFKENEFFFTGILTVMPMSTLLITPLDTCLLHAFVLPSSIAGNASYKICM